MQNNMNSHSLWVRKKNNTATLEDDLAVSYKAKYSVTILSTNPPPPGIYANNLKTQVQTKTCTQMFTAALFIVAQKWK